MTMFRTSINSYKKGLTSQQIAFVNEFVDSVDPIESAIKAGYSKTDIKRRAFEVIANPKIIAAIEAKIDQSAQAFVLHKCFFVKKLLEIIDSASRQEELLDRSGAPTGRFKLNDAGAALRALDALLRCVEYKSSALSANQDAMQIMCIENLDDQKI